MKLLSLNNISARIGYKPVLSDVSLEIQPGELVALCGPNGAGKSSVLRAVAGLLPLTAGEISHGDKTKNLSALERSKRLVFLPQERRIAWNIPAVEVAALGAPYLPDCEALARAKQALDSVGVGHLADRGVAEISGGERARVLLARAMVNDASLMLADEPIAGLDPDAQRLVLERLRQRAQGTRAVLVSLHDLTLAAQMADRVIVMCEGRSVADGMPVEALSPDVLQSVFGLKGQWVDGPDGPLLSARRAVSN